MLGWRTVINLEQGVDGKKHLFEAYHGGGCRSLCGEYWSDDKLGGFTPPNRGGPYKRRCQGCQKRYLARLEPRAPQL